MAQGYIGLIILLPMLPGIISTLYPLSNRPWLAPIPVFGLYALAADILGGKAPAVAYYGIAGLSVIACAAALMALSAWLLTREAIIFGR